MRRRRGLRSQDGVGQVEELFGIAERLPAKDIDILPPDGSQSGQCQADEGRLIALPAVRNGGKIWGVGLHQQPVVGHQAQERLVGPAFERDDAAKRDVPADGQRRLGKRCRPRIAVEDASHVVRLGTLQEVKGVRLGFTGVQHDRLLQFRGQRKLGGEGVQLTFARRVMVVGVEATFTDGDSALGDGLTNVLRVRRIIPRGGIVRMDAGGKKDQAGVAFGQRLCAAGRGRRLADTDKGPRTFCAGPLDHRVCFISERGIGQMHMTVGKDGHDRYLVARRSDFRGRVSSELSLPAFTDRLVESEVVRGYFDSIQMRNGPAT